MGTALLALCFCALSLILALFVGISPISDKAKIRFMYVGAALSLMAVPNAAKPTSWRMPVPLSSRLARSVRISPSFSARFSKENLQSIGYVLFHTRKDVGQHLFHVKNVRLVKSLEKLPMAYTRMSIQQIYMLW